MHSIYRLMGSMVAASLVIVLILVAIYYTSGDRSPISTQKCFKAAVLDNRGRSRTRRKEEEDPAQAVQSNFQILAKAASAAKERNVDLIVFPEGSLGMRTTNPVRVPDPGGNPCTEPEDGQEILRDLSCMAREHRMFVTAHVLDRQPCTPNASIVPCPADGHYVFNGAVLFDRSGTVLLRYHKIQLFGEMHLNPGSPVTDPRYVDTELGRLSIQICFDMIYEKPGHYLATKHAVDTVIFPTNWFNEAPFLSAAQYQLGWAIGNRVNLLASNGHHPQVGSMGSGVYMGGQKKPEFVAASFADNGQRLVIGVVPKQARSDSAECGTDGNEIVLLEEEKLQPSEYRYQQMNLTGVAMQKIDGTGNSSLVQTGGVSCSIEFEMSNAREKTDQFYYYLLAVNRSRVTEYPWTEEFCAVALCQEKPDEPAAIRFVTASATDLASRFKKLSMTAEFGASTVAYPSVVGYQHQPLPTHAWKYTAGQQPGRHTVQLLDSQKSNDSPISVVGIYGRVYDRDPVYKQVPIHINPQ